MIHSDLNLGNLLFSEGEARAIDFDDCGPGYWMYDLAVALWNWRWDENWLRCRDVLINGYTQIRPLPERQLAYLDLFMASRRVDIALWSLGRTQEHPIFRHQIEGRLQQTSMDVKNLLDS